MGQNEQRQEKKGRNMSLFLVLAGVVLLILAAASAAGLRKKADTETEEAVQSNEKNTAETASSAFPRDSVSSDSLEIDIETLAGELLGTVTSDSLTRMDESIAGYTYFWENEKVKDSIAYTSSGSTACEVAVVEVYDASDAEGIKSSLETRVQNQRSLYASYNTAEAERLESSTLIKTAGPYAVLCVCDDIRQAQEILEAYGFE